MPNCSLKERHYTDLTSLPSSVPLTLKHPCLYIDSEAHTQAPPSSWHSDGGTLIPNPGTQMNRCIPWLIRPYTKGIHLAAYSQSGWSQQPMPVAHLPPQTGTFELFPWISFKGVESRVIRCLVTATSQHPSLISASYVTPGPSSFLIPEGSSLAGKFTKLLPCHLWGNSPFVALTIFFSRDHSDQPNLTSKQEVPGQPPPPMLA